MRKLSFLLTLVIMCGTISAQRLLNKEMCLFNYHVDMSSELADAMAPLKRYIDANDYYNQKGTDLIQASIMNRTYSNLKKLLEKNVECFILPINSFGKRFRYNDYNYPVGTYARAKKQGLSKYYFKVELSLKAAHPENKEIKAGEFIPEVYLAVTLFKTPSDVPVRKFEGDAIGTTALANEKYVLDGILKGTKPENSEHNIMRTVNKAVEEVVRKMKHY